MKTTHTLAQSQATPELIDFILALCWVLEKHSAKVTEQIGDKTRICFRPLNSPIGFTQRDDTDKSMSCQTPILVYLLQFLCGQIILGKDKNQTKVRKLFLKNLSPDLRKTLLDSNFETESLFMKDLFSKFKVSPTSLFVIGQTPTKEPYWYVNHIYIARINRYLNQNGFNEWMCAIACAVYDGHFALGKSNPRLGLGLKTIPLNLS